MAMIYYLGMEKSIVALLNTDIGELKHVKRDDFFQKITKGNLSYQKFIKAITGENGIDSSKFDKLLQEDIYIDNREDIISSLMTGESFYYYLGNATGTLMYVLNMHGKAETVYRIDVGTKVLNANTYYMTWPSPDDNYDGVFVNAPVFTYTTGSDKNYEDAKIEIKEYVMPEIEEFQNNCTLFGVTGIIGEYSESTMYPGALQWRCSDKDMEVLKSRPLTPTKIPYKDTTLDVYEINVAEGVTVLEANAISASFGNIGTNDSVIRIHFPESLAFISPNALTSAEYLVRNKLVIFDFSDTFITDFNLGASRDTNQFAPTDWIIFPKCVKSISNLSTAYAGILTGTELKQLINSAYMFIVDSGDVLNIDIEYIGEKTIAGYSGFCVKVKPPTGATKIITPIDYLNATPLFGVATHRFPKLRYIDGNILFEYKVFKGIMGSRKTQTYYFYNAPVDLVTKGIVSKIQNKLESYNKTNQEGILINLQFSTGSYIDTYKDNLKVNTKYITITSQGEISHENN